MPVSPVEGVRLANAKLRAALTQWQAIADNTHSVEMPVLTDLLETLRQAAQWLQAVPPGATPSAEIVKELSDYRDTVQQLEQLLPAIQARLLAEKARLENARNHLAAAAAWSEARKRTL